MTRTLTLRFPSSLIIAISTITDRVYYGTWTLPPLRFLYFNVAQSLAIFYGHNRPDYYITEGLPLLLTTALPFTLIGVWDVLRPSHSAAISPNGSGSKETGEGRHHHGSIQSDRLSGGAADVLKLFACITIFLTLTMSFIAHKEMRFLFPILPMLHVLAARPLARVFPRHLTPPRKLLLCILVALNVSIAVYTSQYHQRGVIDVLHYIRKSNEAGSAIASRNTTVGFLMPCHSTPWRSHLVHPTINAWALTCEPPLDIPLSERSSYMDEADQFYKDPSAWLMQHMVLGSATSSGAQGPQHLGKAEDGQKIWPERLVFFEQLGDALKSVTASVDGLSYEECWRGFNSHWHDDWRRQGDVVVWCMKETP